MVLASGTVRPKLRADGAPRPVYSSHATLPDARHWNGLRLQNIIPSPVRHNDIPFPGRAYRAFLLIRYPQSIYTYIDEV